VDDGGDATLLVHEGVKWENSFAKDEVLPDPDAESDPEMKQVKIIIRHTLQTEPNKWREMAKHIVGVSEETTTGVLRLKEMFKKGALLFPAINVNDSVTKTKFDNI